MRLTAVDINSKEFSRGIRGYNTEEVDEFLDNIVEDYDQLCDENSKLRDNVVILKEKLEHYEKLESTIQNTLLLAQNTAEQAKENSERQAQLIVEKANETAQKIIDKAHNDVVEINDEYQRVKEEFIKFRVKYRGFINAQIQTFDELEKDFFKAYNVTEVVQELELNSKDVELGNDEIQINNKNIEVSEDLSEVKNFFANI